MLQHMKNSKVRKVVVILGTTALLGSASGYGSSSTTGSTPGAAVPAPSSSQATSS
jgi:hypothetical protein